MTSLLAAKKKHMVGLFWGHSGQDLTLTAVVKMVCFGSGHYDVQNRCGEAFKQILNIHRL